MTKWAFKNNYSFEDKNFARIFKFYVIETPVSGVSARGTSFKERGVNMISLCAAMKRETPFLKEYWFEKAVKDVPKCCEESGIHKNASMNREIAIHTLNNQHCSGKTDSLFYAIRCAFAHGSFAIHHYRSEKYYILENRDREKLKARRILREGSLLKWIDVVEACPQPGKKKAKNRISKK